MSCVVTIFNLLSSVNQASGLGGTAVSGHNADQVETMKPVPERIIKVTFNADRHASMQWNFRPQQTEVFVSTACYLGLIWAQVMSRISAADVYWVGSSR